jgi:hypothetical protein
MHQPILDEATVEEELIEALTHANATAKRTPRRARFGEESPAWESIHQYINFLLDLLEG